MVSVDPSGLFGSFTPRVGKQELFVRLRMWNLQRLPYPLRSNVKHSKALSHFLATHLFVAGEGLHLI